MKSLSWTVLALSLLPVGALASNTNSNNLSEFQAQNYLMRQSKALLGVQTGESLKSRRGVLFELEAHRMNDQIVYRVRTLGTGVEQSVILYKALLNPPARLPALKGYRPGMSYLAFVHPQGGQLVLDTYRGSLYQQKWNEAHAAARLIKASKRAKDAMQKSAQALAQLSRTNASKARRSARLEAQIAATLAQQAASDALEAHQRAIPSHGKVSLQLKAALQAAQEAAHLAQSLANVASDYRGRARLVRAAR